MSKTLLDKLYEYICALKSCYYDIPENNLKTILTAHAKEFANTLENAPSPNSCNIPERFKQVLELNSVSPYAHMSLLDRRAVYFKRNNKLYNATKPLAVFSITFNPVSSGFSNYDIAFETDKTIYNNILNYYQQWVLACQRLNEVQDDTEVVFNNLGINQQSLSIKNNKVYSIKRTSFNCFTLALYDKITEVTELKDSNDMLKSTFDISNVHGWDTPDDYLYLKRGEDSNFLTRSHARTIMAPKSFQKITDALLKNEVPYTCMKDDEEYTISFLCNPVIYATRNSRFNDSWRVSFIELA